MAGELQPLSDKFSIVDANGVPTIYFIQWAQERSMDIDEATTPEQVTEILVEYIAAHPVEWGDIAGTLSAQTDLQTALDGKLTVIDDTTNWGAGFWRTEPGFAGLTIGDAAVDGSVTLGAALGGGFTGFIEFDFPGFIGGSGIGAVSARHRQRWYTYGTIIGYEFDQDVYVAANKIFHEGNLSFGTGLDYTAGVLTATAVSAVLPVVDGSIPPVFLQNPDGSLIYTPI